MVRKESRHTELALLALSLLLALAVGCTPPGKQGDLRTPGLVDNTLLRVYESRTPEQIYSDLSSANLPQGEAEYWAGEAALIKGNLDAARTYFDASIALDPGQQVLCAARIGMADILLLASDYTSAKSGYEKAVEGCSDGRLLFLLGARLCAAAFLAGDSAKADEYYSAWTRDFGELTASFSGASSVANKLKTDLSGSSPFCVQVGVFGNPDRANALVKTLTAAGYVASVKQTEQGYRVLVGPYDAVRHAEEAARKLQSEGYSTILKPWDGR